MLSGSLHRRRSGGRRGRQAGLGGRPGQGSVPGGSLHGWTGRIALILLAAIVLAAPGCSRIQHKPAADGGYPDLSSSFTNGPRGYYDRGRSLAADGLHAQAVADFRRAIEESPKDQWDSTTFGPIGYFPHRELGILYFQRREYDKAIAELEHSMDSAPSARARYYLNKARAARIERYAMDRTAPVLNLESSSTVEITNSLTKVVRGVAVDDTFLAAVTVADQPVAMESASGKKIFRAEVPLIEGENRIRVAASDLAGRTTENHLTVYSDRQGPVIEIEELVVRNNLVTLQGNVNDNMEVAFLRINNERWPITGQARGYGFRLVLPDGTITIVAGDPAGNSTRAVVREHASDPVPAGDLLHDKEADTSPASAAGKDHPGLKPPPGSPGSDVEPPYIRILSPGPGEKTHGESILLEGMVSDASLPIYISVNGEFVPNRKGRKVFFSRLIHLAPGTNTIRIVAADELGNKAGRTLQVHRLVPSYRRLEARMAVAVLPFGLQPGPATPPGAVRDLLMDAFSAQGRFRTVEQAKIDAVFPVPAWSGDLPLTPVLAGRLGKRVGAQAVLTGWVLEYPGAVEILGRLIDAETGTILADNDVFGEISETESLDDLVDELARKFRREIPLAEGSLLEIGSSEVIIDAGPDNRVKPAMQFICYREIPPVPHPVTGQPMVPEPLTLAVLKVVEVDGNFCRAVVVSGDLSHLMASDKVIAL
ncbi:MAG: hypothetical protein WCZ10_05895 [Desulfobulbaceae bacterium]